MSAKSAQVTVIKGAHGKPVAQIAVDSQVSSRGLGGLVDQILSHEEVYKMAGLKFCRGCKSGLDIHIMDRMNPIIDVQFKELGG